MLLLPCKCMEEGLSFRGTTVNMRDVTQKRCILQEDSEIQTLLQHPSRTEQTTTKNHQRLSLQGQGHDASTFLKLLRLVVLSPELHLQARFRAPRVRGGPHVPGQGAASRHVAGFSDPCRRVGSYCVLKSFILPLMETSLSALKHCQGALPGSPPQKTKPVKDCPPRRLRLQTKKSSHRPGRTAGTEPRLMVIVPDLNMGRQENCMRILTLGF